MLGARLLDVYPNVSSSVSGIDVDQQWTGELNSTYFFTPNFAVEGSITWAKQDVTFNGTGVGALKIMPVTFTAQYHFTNLGAWKPYVGGGFNYTYFYDTDLGNNAGASVSRDSWGGALQGGFDYQIQPNWYFNVDVKYLWINNDIRLNNVNLGTAARSTSTHGCLASESVIAFDSDLGIELGSQENAALGSKKTASTRALRLFGLGPQHELAHRSPRLEVAMRVRGGAKWIPVPDLRPHDAATYRVEQRIGDLDKARARRRVVKEHRPGECRRLRRQGVRVDRAMRSAGVAVRDPVPAHRKRSQILAVRGSTESIVDDIGSCAAGRILHRFRELAVACDDDRVGAVRARKPCLVLARRGTDNARTERLRPAAQ